MIRKYGVFRKISAQKTTKYRRAAVMSALLQQKKEKLIIGSEFFLSYPPREPDTRYEIKADGIIEADKIIMA